MKEPKKVAYVTHSCQRAHGRVSIRTESPEDTEAATLAALKRGGTWATRAEDCVRIAQPLLPSSEHQRVQGGAERDFARHHTRWARDAARDCLRARGYTVRGRPTT